MINHFPGWYENKNPPDPWVIGKSGLTGSVTVGMLFSSYINVFMVLFPQIIIHWSARGPLVIRKALAPE
jgi:hypothetical protein